MTVPAIGTVFLGGIKFTTDPQIYNPMVWEKRHRVHKGLEGAVTIQDFGTFQKDNTVRLGSGTAGYLEESVVDSLHGAYRTRGAVFTLTDWRDNEFTVFITRFEPVPTFIGSLYTYDMELQVTAIAKLFGVVFTGA